jgi:hypothetical protein
MGFLPPYLLKISVTLIIVYVVYWSLFRRLTFYTWNRFYLVVLSVLSFVIPLVDISYLLRMKQTEVVTGYIPSLQGVIESSDFSAYQFVVGSPAWMNVIYLVVATGIVVLFIRLIIQFLSFRKMVRSADVIMEGSVRVYQVHESIVPFSFVNSIFINAAQHNEEELKEIIRHEFIHVKQRHTIDIMVSEILVMLNWYNPFAWMMRHSIRQNLEFIADEQVIRTGIDKRQYQYLLLKVVGASTLRITTKFNFNSLKKRIVMMNKNKTARVHLLRFALVLPVIGLSLVAFRGQQQPVPSTMDLIIDTVPVKSSTNTENIENIHFRNKIVEVTLKNGTTESYDLTDPKQKAAYEKKYGKLQPPPPPPPAPKPPTPPVPTSVSGSIMMPDDIKSINAIETKDGKSKITIVNKNGKTEIYDMNNAKQKAAFESKYGKISIQAEEVPPVAPVPAVSAVPAVTAAPSYVTIPDAPVAPVPPLPQKPSDDEFFKNNPNVRSVYIDDSNNLFITLKNGQKERYSLNDGKDKKMVIEKYGSLPKPPPPPPVPAKVSE